MKKRGFAIVEVLVAFLILTSALTLLTYSQKTFNTNLFKLTYYETIYTTVRSLKNKIDIELALNDKMYYEGQLNKLNYIIKLEKIQEAPNLSYDNMEGKYIPGFHTYTLYKVTIILTDLNKKFTFFKMKTFFDQNQLEQSQQEL